jgi:acyl-CoA hydrolase
VEKFCHCGFIAQRPIGALDPPSRRSLCRDIRAQGGPAPEQNQDGVMTAHFTDPAALADEILREVGRRVVVGLPLGLGKANHVINALVARAMADPYIELTIFTALTLETPRPTGDIERRFFAPVAERLFAGYPALSYAEALHRNALPPNIKVVEFFFLAGRWLRNPAAQQAYISANYTHAAQYLIDQGVNVVAQLVACDRSGAVPAYSLSCNTDMTLDLLTARQAGRADFRLIGQVNSELPFMPGPGVLGPECFSAMLDDPSVDFPLFAPPAEPVSDAKYAIGLHTSGLIRDGGTLQIGIGQAGDGLARSLILRHREPEAWHALLQRLSPAGPRESGPFTQGLYGVSEMFFEAFLALIEAGVIRREVDGALLHAAFFLGPRAFYRALREMPAAERARIRMMPVSFTNELYGDEMAKRAARRDARFVNSAMMVTLLGAAVSDGLASGQVVSGVGGQYNFVAQAFALEGARAILAVDATRGAGRRLTSNILWSYGHQTVPRHLRDIVVTEYGVADLRGRSDAETIAALLAVTDSRFQDGLLRTAKDAGKLPRGYEIPRVHRDNTPERIAAALAPAMDQGLLPRFPFGSDFTATEQRLIPALQALQQAAATPLGLLRLIVEGVAAGDATADERAALERMALAQPAGLRDRAARLALTAALRRAAG